IDTSEGKPANRDDPHSKLDFHGVVVYDRTGNEVSAIWHGTGDQHELGLQCLWAAQFYNNAWVAPELPYGMVILDVFKTASYDHIFNRQAGDDKWDEEDTDALGWKTTTSTRPVMIEQFKDFLNDNPAVYSKELIKEMRTFVRDKNGKAIHLPGEHDDILFAFMIAVQLHLRCPMDAVPYAYETTFSEETPESTGLPLNYSGAIDPYVGCLDDDSDYYY
ncbi:MAG: hypothetical protein ACYSW7_11830, partial [Planctomycetota bacterium]